MRKTIYVVHSDDDENNVGCEFVGSGSKQKAIRYAKDNKDCKTWVERIYFDTVTEQYEYPGDVLYDYLNG